MDNQSQNKPTENIKESELNDIPREVAENNQPEAVSDATLKEEEGEEALTDTLNEIVGKGETSADNSLKPPPPGLPIRKNNVPLKHQVPGKNCGPLCRMETDDELLHRLYYDPASSSSFSGVSKLYRAIKDAGRSISQNKIKKWLEKQKLYTTNRHSISKFPRRQTIIPSQYYLFDSDNAYMKNYTKDNDGNSFFLLVVDDFSKRVFTRPIKNLTGREMKKALDSILSESDRKPKIIRTDKGSEFVNSTVKDYLAGKDIKHIVTQNETKAAFAERTIYTIKKRLIQAMISKKTKRWLEILPKITDSYNNSYHRTIGMKPNEVTKENEADIWNRVYLPQKQAAKRPGTTNRKPEYKFKLGDIVKVTIAPGKFNRGYNERFSQENFSVTSRATRQGKDVYELKDFDNETILGKFYPQQLQRVTTNDNEIYEIEKIVKSRTVRGKKQHLVHWRGWSKKFDSWIDADTIQNYK